MLTAITRRSEVRQALKDFYRPFKRAKLLPARPLGHQGDTTQDHRIYWHPDPGLWAVLEASESGNRSWNCFGTTDPTRGRANLAISCEINIPHEGTNRNIAGVFARDADDVVYIAHTGKVRGIRKGLDKTHFVDFFPGKEQWESIHWPEAKPMSCIVISALDDPALVQRVQNFVQSVEAFKAGKASWGGEPAIGFSPEFSGQRAPYTPPANIRARCDHGRIVNALAERLQPLCMEEGIVVGNNAVNDLFIARGHRRLALFEVKTGSSPGDIYSAIGQLMYYTAEPRTQCARVAVLPAQSPGEVLTRLKHLGLHVCTYLWERRMPIFPDLPSLVRRLLQC